MILAVGKSWHGFFNNSSCSACHSSNVGQDTVCSICIEKCSASSFSFVSSITPGAFPGDCLWSEGSQLPSAAKASSFLLPFCWTQLPLTCIQQLLKEPSALWCGFQLTSSKDHPWSNLCPVGITAEVRNMRESAPTKPPARKQSSHLTCEQGAGAPMIYMCADRWSDLTYSLQIPLSLKKVAGSYQPQESKWFLINQPPTSPNPC